MLVSRAFDTLHLKLRIMQNNDVGWEMPILEDARK